MARITRGGLQLKRHQHELGPILAKAVETVAPLLEQRAHHFTVDVPARPVFVDADETRLSQVFANLLTNAAKYTDPGGHISVGLSSQRDQAVVVIRDDGIGIPPDILPKVFDLFVQGEQGSERTSGGLGVGLALVRTLVNLHGGTVEATSGGPG